jgi:hypothetical protein
VTSPLADERGGVVAKLLVLIVVLAVLAGGALYLYGIGQQPLAFDGTHVATGDHQRNPETVAVARGATISIATVVRNVGRLPVTLEGLVEDPPNKEDPFVPIDLGLGDGTTPIASTSGFTPPALDPSSGIGVVITYGVNPNLVCARFTDEPGDARPLPPVDLRFSSYGVESTQAVPLDTGAPTIEGLTRANCEAAVS